AQSDAGKQGHQGRDKAENENGEKIHLRFLVAPGLSGDEQLNAGGQRGHRQKQDQEKDDLERRDRGSEVDRNGDEFQTDIQQQVRALDDGNDQGDAEDDEEFCSDDFG